MPDKAFTVEAQRRGLTEDELRKNIATYPPIRGFRAGKVVADEYLGSATYTPAKGEVSANASIQR